LLEAAQPPGADAPRVVAACFPDEDHQLGLLIVAWHLARHGVRLTYLGATLPIEELAQACRKSRAQAALLSVTRQSVFRRHQRDVADLFDAKAGRLFVGGQGVPPGARGAGRHVVFPPGTTLSAVITHIAAEVR
jgi:methylmalonyl-CoA mutase cobalamin-binding subunit